MELSLYSRAPAEADLAEGGWNNEEAARGIGAYSEPSFGELWGPGKN